MTKPRVYIDTTIVSYLTAFPSRDLVRAAHQQVTREWWRARGAFDLYASQVVLQEASAGDPAAATERLEALQEASLLAVTEEAIALGEALVRGGGLPAKASADALHVAVAAVHGMEYLLSWNCTHIANVTLRGKIESICRESGVDPPAICTPIEFVAE